jgi:hypothetical protein
MDVGIVFVPDPVANERLFVKLIVKLEPVGTVISTGDQVGAAGFATDEEFSAAHVAVEPVTADPHK